MTFNTSPYSTAKVLYHIEDIALIKQGHQINPKQIHLIISDYCNHNCGFCSYRKDGYISNELFFVTDKDGNKNNNPKRFIPKEKCFEIIDDCVAMGIPAIQLTGGGEVTVHPDHCEVIRYALQNKRELALVTNGTVLKPELLEMIPQFKWIRFSLDAGCKETYSKIREVPENFYNKFMVNVANCVGDVKSKKSDTVIGIGYVVTKDNYLEIFDACKTAYCLGVNNIRISAEFQSAHSVPFEEIAGEIYEQINQAQAKFTRNNFKIINRFSDRYDDLITGNPDFKECYYSQFVTYIGADLNVYMCCTTAYSENGKIGSIKDQSFKNMWYSQKKRDKMKNFDSRGCELCMFQKQNKIVHNIFKKPTHENFV